jgi:putative addiction module component (TIGR02574 family)
MAHRPVVVEELSAEERIELMGRLWDSLDSDVAAPISDSLAAELDRREAEADADPEAGETWPSIRSELTKKTK